MTTLAGTEVVAPMTARQRDEFGENGFLVIRGALSEPEAEFYAGALDRTYQAEKAAGRLLPGGAMHRLSAIANCRDAIVLIDHPRTFPLVWSVLGWNVHLYHSHLDVHPPLPGHPPLRP
jgi:ectoine hydroxylase